MGTLSLALFNSASYYDPEPVVPPFEPGPALAGRARAARTVRTFGVVYAVISVMVLLWGLYNYQRRVTLIKSKYPGSFGTCAATYARRPDWSSSRVRGDVPSDSCEFYRDRYAAIRLRQSSSTHSDQ